MKRVVLTAWCGLCKAEKQRDPGKLGEVVRDNGGRLVWVTPMRWSSKNADPRKSRRMGVVLGRADTPQLLSGWCRIHQFVGLSTADVIDKRGSVTIYQ